MRQAWEYEKEGMGLQYNYGQQAADAEYKRNLQMWKDTNFGAQRAEMEKAGLSVGLMYGNGGGSAASTAGGTIQQIINGINDAENNIIYPKLGYNIQVMVEPNGDPAYTSAAESIDYIKMITRQQQTQLGYDYINLLEDGLNINKLKVARYFADGATLQDRQTEITNNFINVESATVCMYGDLGMLVYLNLEEVVGQIQNLQLKYNS